MKTTSDKSACTAFARLSLASILLTAGGLSGYGSVSVPSRQTTDSKQNQSARQSPSPAPAQIEGQSTPDKKQKTESRPRPDVFTDDIKDDGVLIDFRSELAFAKPSLAPAEKRAILQAVYGADVAANGIEINSIAAGSFTQASAKETAYLLQRGGARAAVPSSLEETQLAIFHGSHLVTKIDVKNYNFILRTSDVDQDGLDELLLSGSNYQMGESTRWAKLVEIENAGVREVKDFGIVLKDSCGNPTAQNREVQAALIKYDPQHTSQIDSSYYRAACSAKKKGKLYPDIFRAVSKK